MAALAASLEHTHQDNAGSSCKSQSTTGPLGTLLLTDDACTWWSEAEQKRRHLYGSQADRVNLKSRREQVNLTRGSSQAAKAAEGRIIRLGSFLMLYHPGSEFDPHQSCTKFTGYIFSMPTCHRTKASLALHESI